MKRNEVTQRIITIILVVLVAMMAGCKKNDSTEASKASEKEVTSLATETTVMEIYDMGPGTAVDIFDSPEFTENTEVTEADTEQLETTESTLEIEHGVKDENVSENPKVSESQPERTEKELTEYERYLNMSGDEQMELIQSFESVETFFNWLNNAKAEYEAANPGVKIGDGTIDLGEIIEK